MRDRAYERYVEAVETCSRLARRDLEGLVARLDTKRKKDSRDALLAAVPAIVEKYGAMAAAAAAEYYEQKRALQVGGSYHATLAENAPLKSIESSVRYACGHLFKGKIDV